MLQDGDIRFQSLWRIDCFVFKRLAVWRYKESYLTKKAHKFFIYLHHHSRFPWPFPKIKYTHFWGPLLLLLMCDCSHIKLCFNQNEHQEDKCTSLVFRKSLSFDYIRKDLTSLNFQDLEKLFFMSWSSWETLEEFPPVIANSSLSLLSHY